MIQLIQHDLQPGQFHCARRFAAEPRKNIIGCAGFEADAADAAWAGNGGERVRVVHPFDAEAIGKEIRDDLLECGQFGEIFLADAENDAAFKRRLGERS